MNSMTTQHLTYSHPLLLRKRQYDVLDGVLRDLRRLYNAALEERISRCRKSGKTLTAYDQIKSLTLTRRDHDEYGISPYQSVDTR